MRRRECLVQVHVDDIEAHVAGTHLAEDGIQVRTVVVQQATGLVDDAVFEEATDEHIIQFEPGDVLFLYTDGISEAMNSKREEFGEERLYDIIATNHVVDAYDMQNRILRHVNEFVNDAEQHDDITMIIAQFI